MSSANSSNSSNGASSFAAALAIIALTPFAAPAGQQPTSHQQGSSWVVSYADLDIHTTGGAEQLLARIQSAAARVCPQVDIQQLQRYRSALRCRGEVVASAVHSIGSPQLAAVYASRIHHLPHSPV